MSFDITGALAMHAVYQTKGIVPALALMIHEGVAGHRVSVNQSGT